MIDYEVGQIPGTNLGIVVKSDKDEPVSLIGYTTVRLEMLGSDNEHVNLAGVNVETVPDRVGGVVIIWPKDRSLFNKPGRYVIRLALGKSDGTLDYTRKQEISVRTFGRLSN